MSGDNQLEIFVPSKHPAFVGSFCFCRPPLFAHPHRVDAQRERDAVRKIEPKGEPFAAGELACCVLHLSYSSTVLSSLRSRLV